MTPPSLRGKRMDTFFHLLGNNENAMTISLGWCMSQVPSFLDCLGDALDTPNLSTHNAIIRLQKHQRGTGITDLEIYAPGYAAWIIEAKRGFTVPSADQLERFSVRLAQPDYRSTKRGLVVLAASDRNNQWLSRKLPHRIGLIPFHALSWREIQRMAEEARNDAGRSGKNLLRQFHTYLGSEGNMQDQHSNWLYVVSLSRSTFGGGVTKFIDVVERHRMYFHPVGGGPGGWPVEPPNYMAFRYNGKLQSIHHVDDYDVVTDVGPFFPNQPSEEWHPTFLYRLGPPICSARKIPIGGNWRARRVWCFIDTLLTSDTVAEALEATKQRVKGYETSGDHTQ